jgi:energy-coupling factor transport system substrate-specific component
MKKSTLALAALLAVVGAWVAGEILEVKALTNIALMSLILAGLVVVYYYLRFEEKKSDAKLIAILGSLAALSVAGRCLFAAIPNVKPSTFIIIIAGYVFGPLAGFMVGATTALVSNIFFGQGPWTVWQMLAWGLAGFVAGLLGPKKRLEGRCAAWGFLFGWFMNLYFVLGFIHPAGFSAFLTACGASLWFDALHAAGNFIFAFLLGPALIAMLRRYQARFFFETGPATGEAELPAVEGEVRA